LSPGGHAEIVASRDAVSVWERRGERWWSRNVPAPPAKEVGTNKEPIK
jgi:hypothetical protein